LVEVVVAGAVFLVATSAVIGAFSYARRTASLTENRLACLHIAREALETLKLEGYPSTALSIGRHNRLPGHPPARGYYEVVQDNTYGQAKQITVVVNWVEPTGMSQSLSLSTVHCRALHP
jgi:type II secretory pathway pseudopilin PulG